MAVLIHILFDMFVRSNLFATTTTEQKLCFFLPFPPTSHYIMKQGIAGIAVVAAVFLATTTREVRAWTIPFSRVSATWRTTTETSNGWKPVPYNVLQNPTTDHEEDDDDDRLHWTNLDLNNDKYWQVLGEMDEPSQRHAMKEETFDGNFSTRPLHESDTDDSRISYTDAGTLQVHFPATGLTSQAVVAGTFGVAWFSALLPATTLAAAPMLLPFYLAGGLVAKQALVDPFTSTTLSVGTYAWSLDVSRYHGSPISVAAGATLQVSRAVVKERSSVNEQKQVRYSYDLQLELQKGDNPVTIKSSFDNRDEPERFARIINQQLEVVRSSLSDAEDPLLRLPSRLVQ